MRVVRIKPTLLKREDLKMNKIFENLIAFTCFFMLVSIPEVSLSWEWAFDNEFASNGIALYEGAQEFSDEVGNAIAIQPDGKIVVAGYTGNGGRETDVLILRYNPDGTLDNTFGDNGVVTYDSPTSEHDEARAVALQEDGKIVAVGYNDKFEGYELENVLVIRLNADGSLDNTFGTSGVVSTDVEVYDYGNAVAIQDDGKILIAGETSTANDKYVLLMRYNSDGSIDTTFGDDGIVKYDDVGWDIANDLALQHDNKIVLTGTTSLPSSLGLERLLVLRYTESGILDNTFGTDGVVIHDSGYAGTSGSKISVQQDGLILVGGGIWDYSSYNNAVILLRLNANGTFDDSFGIDGVSTFNRGGPDYLYGNSFAMQPDGKAVFTGYFNGRLMFIRFNQNGNLDTSFNGTGFFIDPRNAGNTYGRGVAIQSDGKIMSTGHSTYHDQYSDSALLTARLSTNATDDLDIFGMDVGNKWIYNGTCYGQPCSVERNIIQLDTATFPVPTYKYEIKENGVYSGVEYYEKGESQIKLWGVSIEDEEEFYDLIFFQGLVVAWAPLNIGEHSDTSTTAEFIQFPGYIFNTQLIVDVIGLETFTLGFAELEAYKVSYKRC